MSEESGVIPIVEGAVAAVGEVASIVLPGAKILPVIVSLVEAATQEFPALSQEFQTIFASATPTAEQFAALRAKVASEDFGVVD